jgi:citronellol/citronellal dehydrogenase
MIYKDNLYKGANILVTGGGSGIGKSIAMQYLQLGARVLITGRKEEKLANALAELKEYGPCSFQVCDIREMDQIEDLVKYVQSEFGSLNFLINNAGGQFPTTAEDLSVKGWDAVIRNNLNGTWYMTHTFGTKFFIPQKHGVIVNIIVNIYRGVPGMVHTGAARAGIDNFTKTLAVEWSKYNIKINAIAPGIIDSTGLEQYPDELKKGIYNKVPAKRLGTTDEVAQLCMFMTSPAADYITGETIYIDGGWRLYGDIFDL